MRFTEVSVLHAREVSPGTIVFIPGTSHALLCAEVAQNPPVKVFFPFSAPDAATSPFTAKQIPNQTFISFGAEIMIDLDLLSSNVTTSSGYASSLGAIVCLRDGRKVLIGRGPGLNPIMVDIAQGREVNKDTVQAMAGCPICPDWRIFRSEAELRAGLAPLFQHQGAMAG
jgi:hypothetical protein